MAMKRFPWALLVGGSLFGEALRVDDDREDSYSEATQEMEADEEIGKPENIYVSGLKGIGGPQGDDKKWNQPQSGCPKYCRGNGNTWKCSKLACTNCPHCGSVSAQAPEEKKEDQPVIVEEIYGSGHKAPEEKKEDQPLIVEKIYGSGHKGKRGPQGDDKKWNQPQAGCPKYCRGNGNSWKCTKLACQKCSHCGSVTAQANDTPAAGGKGRKGNGGPQGDDKKWNQPQAGCPKYCRGNGNSWKCTKVACQNCPHCGSVTPTSDPTSEPTPEPMVILAPDEELSDIRSDAPAYGAPDEEGESEISDENDDDFEEQVASTATGY